MVALVFNSSTKLTHRHEKNYLKKGICMHLDGHKRTRASTKTNENETRFDQPNLKTHTNATQNQNQTVKSKGKPP